MSESTKVTPATKASLDAQSALEAAGTLRWYHWSVVVLSLGLTILAWQYARNQLNDRISLQFEREADQVVELVIERMSKYEDALLASAAFIEANDGQVDMVRWQQFASSIQLDQRYQGINGIGLIASVTQENLAEFVETQRSFTPSFDIHPKRVAQEYWPIHSIVPLLGNEQAFGLDIAHESNRISAAKAARDTGTAQVTAPIVLVQDSMQTPGFLFYEPFYRRTTIDGEPAKVFGGLVYAPFVFQKLLEGVLEKERRHIKIRITDDANLLFDEHLASHEDYDPEPLFFREIPVPVYGRTWEFNICSTKSFRESVDSTQPTTILFVGLLLSFLLTSLFVANSRAARRAFGYAKQMTNDLEKLGLAARVNQIGVWDLDPISGRLQWDDAMFSLYGCRQEDFNGAYEAWCSSLHPEDRNEAEATLQAAIESGSFDCEFRVIHSNGVVRYISAKAVVFFDENGRAIRMLGTNMDITDRKRAASELEETRRMQAAIQDYAGVAIIATDNHGLIKIFNRSAEQMLGYSKEELLEKQTPATFHDQNELVQRATELSDELNRTIAPGFEVVVAKASAGVSEQREWKYVRKDSTVVPVLLTVTALRDEQNRINGYLGIAADISERKIASQEIENANASLARSNEELGQFAYVASHDLQEPLRKVTSFCELLREECSGELTSDGHQYITYIVDSARRMRTLIKDLLEYSRIESAASELTNVDTNEAVRFAIDNLTESIRESGAVITVDTLPIVEAYPSKLAQLFQNLIGNAIKYRGERTPKVHVSGVNQKNHWSFAIEDNGIGILPEHRDQIFGIFKRLHTQSEYRGNGIGLAICKRIVEQLGGQIWVETSESGGSIFRFTLPRTANDSTIIPEMHVKTRAALNDQAGVC